LTDKLGRESNSTQPEIYFPACHLPFFIRNCQNCRLEFRLQAAVWSRLEFHLQAAVITIDRLKAELPTPSLFLSIEAQRSAKRIVTDQLFSQLHLILPIGTQVVARVEIKAADGQVLCPRGAVGEIIKSPDDGSHSYRVRFVNGVEAALHRHEITIRKQYQQAAARPGDDILGEFDLYDFVIYRCVVGSRAFGLAGDDSDTDRRGIYLAPADLQWSLYGAPQQLENDTTQECYWELQKFLILALKANPNILECLYTPLVETVTPIAQELLAMRESFLSKLVYQTYNGYVMSQFKKLEQDLRSRGAIKWKHAMHLIRLLIAGVTVLKEGFVPVDVGDHRDSLLAIKRGEMDWQEVNKLRLSLHKDFDAALDTTKLPERPDYERANAFLVSARRSMAQAADADRQT
jgi:uncharacterized protein